MEVSNLLLVMLIAVFLVDGLLLHSIMSLMLAVFHRKQIIHIAVDQENAIPALQLDTMRLFAGLQYLIAMQPLILADRGLSQLLQRSNLGQQSAPMKM